MTLGSLVIGGHYQLLSVDIKGFFKVVGNRFEKPITKPKKKSMKTTLSNLVMGFPLRGSKAECQALDAHRRRDPTQALLAR